MVYFSLNLCLVATMYMCVMHGSRKFRQGLKGEGVPGKPQFAIGFFRNTGIARS